MLCLGESARGVVGDLAVLGVPEEVVDLLHGVHQLVGSLKAHVHLDGGAELGSLPESVVQLGEGGEVLRLEVVSPKDE